MRYRDQIRLLSRLALFLPLVFLPAFLDWALVASGLQARHLSAYRQLARQLVTGSGMSVGNDIRALKLAAAPLRAASAQIVVLGSSRALTVTGAWFPGRTLWNTAVDNGGLADSAALFQIALDSGCKPDLVILEVFPSLDHEPIPGASHALLPARNRALSRYGIPVPLTSPGFSWNDTIRRWRATLSEITPEAVATHDYQFFLPDGSMRVPDQGNLPDQTVRAALARLSAAQVEWRRRSVPEPADALLFRRMLDDFAARGIRVVVLLVPVHPLTWTTFSAHGGYSSQWLRHELAPRNISVVGDYSPHVTGAGPADFIDSVHPRPHLVRRLLTEAGVIARGTPEPGK